MNQVIKNKILTAKTLSAYLARWRLKGYTLVFTNGCFDLLHYGHIQYLTAAKSLGDKLIIGINSTSSVQRLKGKHRPINDDLTRLSILASFYFVDAIMVFSEDTPYELIQKIQPDILVKGGDYSIENIVGADIVLGKGGIVKSLPFIEGYSTTNIENKIKDSTQSHEES